MASELDRLSDTGDVRGIRERLIDLARLLPIAMYLELPCSIVLAGGTRARD